MLIVWDEPKRLTNLQKHGLDFADFEAGFDFETALVEVARTSDVGSARMKVIGDFKGQTVVAAVIAPLGQEAISLISLRRASRSERRRYDAR
jgi:uncharacterized protein